MRPTRSDSKPDAKDGETIVIVAPMITPILSMCPDFVCTCLPLLAWTFPAFTSLFVQLAPVVILRYGTWVRDICTLLARGEARASCIPYIIWRDMTR